MADKPPLYDNSELVVIVTFLLCCLIGIGLFLRVMTKPSDETCAVCVKRCDPYTVRACMPFTSGVSCDCNMTTAIERAQ